MSAKCPSCGHVNIAGEEACQECGGSLYEPARPRSKGTVQKKILEGTISQIKPHDAICVKPTQTVAEAVELMRKKQMGCVLVMRNNELAGICTERDILIQVAGSEDPAKLKIVEIMKPRPQTLKEDDSIAFAFHDMAVNGYRHIPVVRKDGTFGLISSRDLLRYLCQ